MSISHADGTGSSCPVLVPKAIALFFIPYLKAIDFKLVAIRLNHK